MAFSFMLAGLALYGTLYGKNRFWGIGGGD
jgi:hypothetical protein